MLAALMNKLQFLHNNGLWATIVLFVVTAIGVLCVERIVYYRQIDRIVNVVINKDGYDAVSEGGAFYAIYEYPDIDDLLRPGERVITSRVLTQRLLDLSDSPDTDCRRRATYAIGRLFQIGAITEDSVRDQVERRLMQMNETEMENSRQVGETLLILRESRR